MASTNNAVYVYCVVRAAHRPTANLAVTLPDAEPIKLSPIDRTLFLVTSNVSLDVYGPSNLEPRLQNLEWVAEVAVAHEAVVEYFARRRTCTVVPMKMFTMFSSVERAVSDVRRRRATIDRAIRRIAGCDEWGVRITRAPSAGGALAGGAMPRAATRSSSRTGAAFLKARKDARDAARSTKLKSRAAAHSAFVRLRRLAAAARRIDASDGGTNPPILDAAFLVKSSARAGFEAEARRLAADCAAAGATMAITGPWPAYNFVEAHRNWS